VRGLLDEIARAHRVKGLDLRVATFSLFGMMNWIYNWYNPRKDVDVTELSRNISRLFLLGFLNDGTMDAATLETGRHSHLERTVSMWELGIKN
jgi:hypothetical protein